MSTTNIGLLSDTRYSEQTLHGGRVDTGRCVLIDGCVVLPLPTPPTTNISLLSDVCQRTNLAGRAGVRRC